MANQHGQRTYYSSQLSFNADAASAGKLLNAAHSLKEALRDAQNLINVYTKDGAIKKQKDKQAFELFSDSKAELDRLLPDLGAALKNIEAVHDLRGLFSLNGTPVNSVPAESMHAISSAAKPYDTLSAEFFGPDSELKKYASLIKSLGGSISAKGRLQHIELPQGAINPVTGKPAIKSLRGSFRNYARGRKDYLTSKGLSWEEYQNGTDATRKNILEKAMQFEKEEFASRPDIAEKSYASKERVARANADATERRIDEIIANNERPVLPATTVAKLSPEYRAKWTAYVKHWQMQSVTPEMAKTAFYDRQDAKERDSEIKKQYIKEHPESDLARKEALRLINIASREEKARLLKAERTPGTPEFQAAAERRLDRNAATDEAEVRWAKKHRRNPMAKAILKHNRNKTAGGRALNKALAVARAGAIGMVIGVIATAVNAMVKFLSLLPDIASSVRKVATKGAQYNISEELMNDYSALGEAVGLGRNVFSTVQGSIHSQLSSITNSDINTAITKIAPLSAVAQGKSTNEIVSYFTGKAENPDAVMRSVASDVMKATFLGKTVLRGGFSPNAAFSRNVADAEDAFGMGEMLSRLFEKWKSLSGTDPELYEKIRNETIAGGDYIQLMIDAFKPPVTKQDVAGAVQYERGKEVADNFQDLKANYEEIRDGILIKILSYMEPIANFLRSILAGVLEFLDKHTPLAGQFTETLNTIYGENAAKNQSMVEMNDAVLQAAEIRAVELRKVYGFTDKTKREKAIWDFEKGILPEGMSWKDASAYFGAERLLSYAQGKREELLSDEAWEGKKLVSGVTSNAYGNDIYTYSSQAMNEYTNRMDKVILEHGTSKAELEATKLAAQKRIKEIEDHPVWEDAKYGIIAFGQENGGNGVPSGITKETYRSAGEEMRGLKDFVSSITSVLAEMEKLSSDFNSRQYRLGAAKESREAAERTSLYADTVSHISQQLGEEYGRLFTKIAAHEINVRINLSADAQEYSIRLEDAKGNEIKTVHGVHNPIQRSVQLNDMFDFQAAAEAWHPTPQGSHRAR